MTKIVIKFKIYNILFDSIKYMTHNFFKASNNHRHFSLIHEKEKPYVYQA